MATWEYWLDQQKHLVDAGVIAAKFILQSPDGDAWGTWPAQFGAIEDSIRGILDSLRKELPKGKHACTLISFDGGGQQLSSIPITLVGASSEASEGANTLLTQRRADALQISNFDKQFESMRRSLDSTCEMLTVQSVALGKLLGHVDQLEEASVARRTEVAKEEGKQARLNSLLTGVMPLLEVGAGLLAELGAGFLERKNLTAKEGPKEGEPAKLPPAPPEPPPAGPSEVLCPHDRPVSGTCEDCNPQPKVADLDHVQPANAGQSAKPRSDGSGQEPGKPEANVGGRSERNERLTARANGRKTEKPNRAARGGHQNTRKERGTSK